MAKPIHLENRSREGEKLISPTAERNKEFIAKAISPHIPSKAKLLEIASGTGQHAAHLSKLRPDITIQPSDPDESSRDSQNIYRQGNSAILPSINIDVTAPTWWGGFDGFDAIFCANMIHIAPIEASLGLAKGAAQLLGAGGVLCLYGPFLDGENSAQSNLDFDTNLRRRNKDWGVRELNLVKHIFADSGLKFIAQHAMPRNNLTLVFAV